MKRMIKIFRVMMSLIIISSLFVVSHSAYAFQEGWENASIGTYTPDMALPLISADEGDWIIGDTVSEFPECGTTPHTAEIFLNSGSRSLRLTSRDSHSSCADNIWIHIVEVPGLLNPGFSVPLNSNTIISFEETGSLIDPKSGYHTCVSPPCGDTASLVLEDERGNMLAYVLQRAPDAVPNEIHSFYREVFLDPNAGSYSRNLFEDFSTIPDFHSNIDSIRQVVFKLHEHGSATIDNICIGTSGCVTPQQVPASISGSIGLADGTPLCAMVLANGQYMFTCGDHLGQYNLSVPLDANGRITLYGFCSGLAPFKAVLSPAQASSYDIIMAGAAAGSAEMTVDFQTEPGTDNPNYTRIWGTVTYNGQDLCAMVLANGQNMFSCGNNLGTFDLEVPLDGNGEITLYVFCSGKAPYKYVFTL